MNAMLVILAAVIGIAVVEAVDRRSIFGPISVIREALSTAQPDLELGSPRWTVAAALALPTFALAALSMLPWTPSAVPSHAVPGIFLAAMLLDFAAVCIATIGWSANRALGVAGLFGAIFQYASYGIVIGFGMIGPAMAAQSLEPAQIGAAQRTWYGLTQPGSLALYALGAYAQAFRAPFDAPLAGAFDALGGLPRLAFRWGLDLLAFTVAAYGAVLFFGAGGGSFAGLMATTIVLVAVMSLVRGRTWAYGRVFTTFWRFAMPLALVNIILVGAVILLRWS